MNTDKYEVNKKLAGFYPYYCEKGADNRFFGKIETLLNETECSISIDEISVLQVLNRYFMFADRTIFQGVKRAPWMGKYDRDKKWSFYDIPDHGLKSDLSEPDIADKLFRLLCDEIKLYVKNSKNIGILLSGGMDSRIVAGVVNHLIEEGEISIDSVTVYTWGVDDSRDVVYSKRITELYGWKWKHFTVDAENLWENFKIAGERGCEYTGLHLHAIPQISSNIKNEVDVMLAGSYGDSVGRAEYSGKHVTDLTPVHQKVRNPAYLLKSTVYNQIKDKWKEDIKKYHELFPRDKPYQQHELDYQIHYMRRMLNPCMELINEKVEMHQVFTHPSVFGFIWSLPPKLRTDTIYDLLLKKLDRDLLSIPWARTGLTYPLREGEPDRFKKKHHEYSKYIHDDLLARIELRLLNHRAIQEGIFNPKTVKEIIALIKKKKQYNFDYLEKISWLISFTYFSDKYDVIFSEIKRDTFTDVINAKVKTPLEYNIRYSFRKIRNEFFS